MEVNNEFDTSVSLALTGFYRQAIVSLRGVLELGLLSVFYNHDDKGYENIKEWANGNEKTPFMQTIKDELRLLPYFTDFDIQFQLFKDLDDVYKILNNYTHIRGMPHSTRGIARRSNTNNFDETALAKWLSIARRVARLVILVHGLRYPVMLKVLPLEEKFGIDIPAGFFLSESQIAQVKKPLTDEEANYIEALVEHDVYSQKVITDVFNQPTMSEKDLKEQRMRSYKMSISLDPNGYKNWYKFTWGIYKTFSKGDQETFLEEAAVLKEWAKENHCLESHIDFEGN